MARRIVAILLLIVLLALIGLLVYVTRTETVTREVRIQLERRLEGSGREAEVGPAQVDTNTGRIDLGRIRITEPHSATPFLTIPRLEATLDLSRFLQGHTATLTRLVLHQPRIRVVKHGDRFNFSDLVGTTNGPGGRLEVTHAQVIGGNATYQDPEQQLTVRLFGLDLEARGRLTKPEAQGHYRANRIEIVRQGRTLVFNQVGGQFRIHGDSLNFDLTGQGLGGSVSGQGHVRGLGSPAPRIAAQVLLSHWQPASLWPGITGRTTSTIDVSGTKGQLAGKLSTRGQLQIRGQTVPHDLTAHWNWAPPYLSLSKLSGQILRGRWQGHARLQLGTAPVAYQVQLQVTDLTLDPWAQGPHTAPWQATIQGDHHTLRVVAQSPQLTYGDARLHNLRLIGFLRDPTRQLRWQADLQADYLTCRSATLTPVDLSGAGTLDQGQVSGTVPTSWGGEPVQPTTLQAEWKGPRLAFRLISFLFQASGQLTTTGQWPFRLSLILPAEGIDRLLQTLQAAPLPVSVVANGAGEVQGMARRPWTGWQAHLSLSPVVYKDGNVLLSSRRPVSLAWRAGTLDLEQVDLTGPAGDVRAAGSWSRLGSTRLQASGILDMALLALFAPLTLGDAEGQAPFHLQLTGPPHAWRGELQVEKAWLNARTLPQNLNNMTIHLMLQGDTLLIRHASTELERVGSVEATGQIRLRNGKPAAYAVEADIRRLYLGGRSFRGEIDAELVLSGEALHPSLSGTVRIAHATYFRDFPSAVERILTPPPPPPKQAGPLDAWHLDVDVTGPGFLMIDNRQAQMTLTGDLTLRGTIAKPLVFGRLKALEGNIRWQGRRYQVTRGQVEWLAGIPHFDVALTSQIAPYRVTVLASGRPGDVAIELTSTPPLPSLDILALIATGQTRRELTTQPLAVVGILAPELLAGTIQTLEQSLGLDLLAITPAPASTLGHLLIGKQLTEQLSVELAQNLEDPTGRELRWHYQVTGNLGVSVRQQSDGDYWVTVEMEHWIR